MAYIDELLAKGERIRYIGRQHTFVLVSNILTELLLIGVLIAVVLCFFLKETGTAARQEKSKE